MTCLGVVLVTRVVVIDGMGQPRTSKNFLRPMLGHTPIPEISSAATIRLLLSCHVGRPDSTFPCLIISTQLSSTMFFLNFFTSSGVYNPAMALLSY